jgi:hypothetical protein
MGAGIRASRPRCRRNADVLDFVVAGHSTLLIVGADDQRLSHSNATRRTIAALSTHLENKQRSAVLRPCCAEQFVAFGNPLISLRWAVNALQHETDGKNETKTA